MDIDLERLFLRLASDVDLDPSSVRYCLNRLRNEGVSFLTCCLPKLSKAVLASLEKGYFDRPTDFAFKGRSLRYFRSLLSGIFDDDGKVLDQVDALALYRLRQLCEYFYKLALPHDNRELIAAERAFVEEDLSLSGAVDKEYIEVLRKDFETYFPEIARAEAHEIFQASRPRPGAGTFAGVGTLKKTGLDWYMLRWIDRRPSKDAYGFEGFFKPYPAYTDSKARRNSAQVDSIHDVKRRVPSLSAMVDDTSDTSEVLFVPKDSRGPRTIVREPYRNLMAQMALHEWLKASLEKKTDYRVNFASQEVNRRLAESSSKTKEWCTLDLKSASDRVAASGIFQLVRYSPGLRLFVSRFRTKSARLSSGYDWPLRKLAGMGSGFTFPMMSLLISLAITRAFVPYYRHGRGNAAAYKAAQRAVYVYGDDIIVPTALYHVATKALARVGLNVNLSKSFVHSHFRESCGGDYYNGNDVAPVRLKLSSCTLSLDGLTLSVQSNTDLDAIAVERHCRQLMEAGLHGCADYLYAALERRLGTRLPFGSGETPYLCRWSLNEPSYQPGEAGNYSKLSCWLPVPRTSGKGCMRDPYIYLSSKLTQDSGGTKWYDVLGLKNRSSGRFNEVEVPREAKLIRRRVSAFALMA